ncbi:MAG: hypothetical protein IT532_08240 [Burkholderiales bacterium]|nr:hypothetical protein [Burkholderiales bacterium]
MTLLKSLLSLLALSLAATLPAHADEAANRLRMAALLEEAHLLLDELKALDPTTAMVDAEGTRLRDADRALAEESARLAQAMDRHNADAAQLGRDFARHRQRCPRDMADAAAIDSCNARGAELVARGQEQDGRYKALQAQRADLNRRIELHNSAWRTWQGARREHAPRLDTNEADAQHWLDRAIAFMGSADFASLNALARSPQLCRGLRLDAARVYSGVRGMRRLTACLEAVTAGLPRLLEEGERAPAASGHDAQPE